MSDDSVDRSCGCLLGLAVGDAVGTTVEFKPRGSFDPLTDMVGGGPFGLRAGEWTDDTSMALCLATSLVDKQGFDPTDQMNRYCNWYLHGYMSSNGECFDIGNTVRGALEAYLENRNPMSGSTDPNMAGNGSIMRLAPVAIYFSVSGEVMEHWSVESSRTTHGAAECLAACRILGRILFAALQGASKQGVLLAARDLQDLPGQALRGIAHGAYVSKTAADVRGSGYVVASLEAAMWAFATTDTFRDAILAAANLGDDADTTAAVCGQVAGAFYGRSGIPDSWLQKLTMRQEIEKLAERLHYHA